MASLDLEKLLTEPEAKPPWLVEGLLCEGTVVIMAGEPGVGKSVLAYTLSLSIASGLGNFLGKQTNTGPVLYFDEENSLPDTRQYLRWAWRGLGKPSLPKLTANLHIEHFSLASQGISRYDYMVSIAAQVKPKMIVLDTTTPACHIQDENDNGEASLALRNLRRVRAVSDPACTMLLLKHSKIFNEASDKEAGQKRTIRGAKSWLGEVDAVLYHVAASGRFRKDGLKASHIYPDKVRAYGLREPLWIEPSWTGTGDDDKGLKLDLKPAPEPQTKEE